MRSKLLTANCLSNIYAALVNGLIFMKMGFQYFVLEE